MRPILAVLALLTLTACGGVSMERPPEIIRDDRGGNILAYVNRRDRIDRPTRIEGWCSSACTILATHPRVCIAPDAVLRFHRPSVRGDVDAIEDRWVRIMAGYFSGEARRLWLREWSKSDRFTEIPARRFVRLESRARLCAE